MRTIYILSSVNFVINLSFKEGGIKICFEIDQIHNKC